MPVLAFVSWRTRMVFKKNVYNQRKVIEKKTVSRLLSTPDGPLSQAVRGQSGRRFWSIYSRCFLYYWLQSSWDSLTWYLLSCRNSPLPSCNFTQWNECLGFVSKSYWRRVEWVRGEGGRTGHWTDGRGAWWCGHRSLLYYSVYFYISPKFSIIKKIKGKSTLIWIIHHMVT